MHQSSILPRIIALVFFNILISSCNNNSDEEALQAAWQAHSESKSSFDEGLDESSIWKVYASISPEDTIHALLFKYTDEVGFSDREISCKVIFENNKEYKLVAPWIDKSITIQKSNILLSDIKIIKRQKD